MFEKKNSDSRALPTPPIAQERADAVELLRVWAAPNGPAQVSLSTKWADPGAWGLLLVDIARHASLAYQRDGRDPNEVLARIRLLFDAEWEAPTDKPTDITDKS